MDGQEILKIFKDSKALLEGHFVLSSGLHSPKYLQCALLLQNPKMAEKLCTSLADKFRKENPSVIVAPALGGVIVSHEVARALGVRSIFTEREDGKMCLRRGFSLSSADRAVIVEDVITTGGSTKEVIDIVKEYGANIVGIGCIADRSKGKIDFGFRYENLIKIDIPTFNPAECPLCKQGLPLVKPGSRKK